MSVDLEHLFRLRLAIARLGEMDAARWWNTRLFGRYGAMTLARGLPRSHEFARARAVFAVVRDRCISRFSCAGTVTLWDMPASIEDEFDGSLAVWLTDLDQWRPFIAQLEAVPCDVIKLLSQLGLIKPPTVEKASRLTRVEEQNSIDVGTVDLTNNDDLSLLATAFAAGGSGDLVVPFSFVKAS